MQVPFKSASLTSASDASFSRRASASLSMVQTVERRSVSVLVHDRPVSGVKVSQSEFLIHTSFHHRVQFVIIGHRHPPTNPYRAILIQS